MSGQIFQSHDCRSVNWLCGLVNCQYFYSCGAYVRWRDIIRIISKSELLDYMLSRGFFWVRDMGAANVFNYRVANGY